jgi:ribosomal protein S18 acetylase RimI-like enzyme
VDAERRLLDAVLQALIEARVRRIESQLMMARSFPADSTPGARWLSAYERNFMILDLGRAVLPPGRVRRLVYVEKWSEHYQEAAAQLISNAYAGHVDSDINDQYRSISGARRFLFNIVQYPGCGAFFKPASFAAFEVETGRLCGICLASMVSRDCGHITQVCVSPWVRGAGVGYELLRQSLEALRAFGCRQTSLTVTASNTGAVELYERMGFRTTEKFSACVWEGF